MDFGGLCNMGPGYKDRTTWLGMRAVHLVMDAD